MREVTLHTLPWGRVAGTLDDLARLKGQLDFGVLAGKAGLSGGQVLRHLDGQAAAQVERNGREKPFPRGDRDTHVESRRTLRVGDGLVARKTPSR